MLPTSELVGELLWSACFGAIAVGTHGGGAEREHLAAALTFTRAETNRLGLGPSRPPRLSVINISTLRRREPPCDLPRADISTRSQARHGSLSPWHAGRARRPGRTQEAGGVNDHVPLMPCSRLVVESLARGTG
jgi:hypothetical protein